MAFLSLRCGSDPRGCSGWSGARGLWGPPGLLVLLLAWFADRPASAAEANRCGRQFIGFADFSRFSRSVSSQGTVVLTSPETVTDIAWNDLVVSWNARLPVGMSLRVEARALYRERATRYYVLGVWSLHSARQPRGSLPGQQDDDAEVRTDILSLVRPAPRVQVRLTFENLTASEPATLAFVGLSLLDTRVEPQSAPTPTTASMSPLPVPERSQLLEEGGETWCSPTAVSMILAYWAERCAQPGWDRAVPEVAASVFDPNWPGTGNWPFNTAYAGTLNGMRAYVTRLANLDELGAWLNHGVPLAASVQYSVLQGRAAEGNGHLVVCTGFTPQGEVIVNDPGTRNRVRRVFPRMAFVRAWAYSCNTVYVIHPVAWASPEASAAHWHAPPGAAAGEE